MKLEGLSPEDQEFEVARRFVQLAGAAAKNAAMAPPTANPKAAAKMALAAAAKKHAPGLLRGGAAIRRARTRLPGGGDNPVAIIRVPRERMIGSGVASSLVHEVGHQAAALLDLVKPLRLVLQRLQKGNPRKSGGC